MKGEKEKGNRCESVNEKGKQGENKIEKVKLGENEIEKVKQGENEKGKQGENEKIKDEQGSVGSKWIKKVERKGTKREKEGTISVEKMEKGKEEEEEKRERKKKGQKWMSKREWSLDMERKGVVEPLVGGEEGGCQSFKIFVLEDVFFGKILFDLI